MAKVQTRERKGGAFMAVVLVMDEIRVAKSTGNGERNQGVLQGS